MRVRKIAMGVAFLAGCDSGGSAPRGNTVGVTASAAPAASAAPSVVLAPSVASVPSAAASVASAAASAWFGAVPMGEVTIARTMSWEVRGAFRADVGVPRGWTGHQLDNGMSGTYFGAIVEPIDKTAAVIVIDHGAIHEMLLDSGAQGWFAQSAAVFVKRWDAPRPVTVAGDAGYSLKAGEGTIRDKPADVLALRHRFPSAEQGPETMMLLAAIARSASAETRAEYAACLASYRLRVP